jgi:putative DNA primase/helicase
LKDSIDRAIEDELPQNGSGRATVLKEIINILKTNPQFNGSFRYNLFTNEQEHGRDNILLSPHAQKGSLITDTDITCLRAYFARNYNMSVNRSNLEDAVTDVALMSQYHPIKDYLESLKWDGIERLDSWLPYICGTEDTAYTRAVSRKMFVAAIKRIYEPGCYYAQLVVLEGRQRMFKSRLVKEIGGQWYASIHLKTHDVKTVVEEMRGKWILEIEELAGFSRQDNEHMKAFLSSQHDRVRLSYARKADDYPRQSIMIATLNPDESNKYLMDQTGNVRYWPVKCSETQKIKIDEFIEIRDQLFAEALVKYQAGEKIWLQGGEEEQLAELEQNMRLSDDPWNQVVHDWTLTRPVNPHEEITTVQVATEVLMIAKERINSGVTRRIGLALKKAGWIRQRKNTEPRYWYYTQPPVNAQEVKWEE